MVNIPEVPDGAYEIGLKATDVSTSSTQVSKIVISSQRGIGFLRDLWNKFSGKLMFSIRIDSQVEKIGLYFSFSTDLCIPGKLLVYIPAILGLDSIVAVGYATWKFTRKRFKRFSWFFCIIHNCYDINNTGVIMAKLGLTKNKKYTEGLSIIDIAKRVGANRNTVSKYIFGLVKAGKVYQRRVGVVSICYLKEYSDRIKKVLEK